MGRESSPRRLAQRIRTNPFTLFWTTGYSVLEFDYLPLVFTAPAAMEEQIPPLDSNRAETTLAAIADTPDGTREITSGTNEGTTHRNDEK